MPRTMPMLYRVSGELFAFRTPDYVTLNGFLIRRSGKTCVIYCHGMGSGFYRPTQVTLAQELKDISLFAINTRGHAELNYIRKGKSQKTALAGTGAEHFEECVYDIEGAIKCMWELGFRKFILAGHSTGCHKIAYYQYKRNDKRVKAMVLLGPTDDYEGSMMNPSGRKQKINLSYKLKRQGKQEVPAVELGFFTPHRLLSEIDLKYIEARMLHYDGPFSEFRKIKVPILAMFGSEDAYAGGKQAEWLSTIEEKTSAAKFRGIIIEGANHSFWNYEREVARSVAAWLHEIGV